MIKAYDWTVKTVDEDMEYEEKGILFFFYMFELKASRSSNETGKKNKCAGWKDKQVDKRERKINMIR